MIIVQKQGRTSFDHLSSSIRETAQKIFIITLVITLVLAGYHLYSLLSGKFASVANLPRIAQIEARTTLEHFNFYTNMSLVVTLISAVVYLWEFEMLGATLLLIAACLFYGPQILTILDYLLEGTGRTHIARSDVLELPLGQIRFMSQMIAVFGFIVFSNNLYERIRCVISDWRQRTRCGKNANPQNHTSHGPVPAFASCWQMPYCREGIRKQCAIYHAKTQCWKQGVGCLCEENIIRLSMGGREQNPVGMGKGTGFIPIGDLIANSEKEQMAHITTKVGPRGVRIPTNPHLSVAQKKERCRNCVIYNEHRRRKFQLLAPVVTTLIAISGALGFTFRQQLLTLVMGRFDFMMSHAAFSTGAVSNAPSLVVKADDTGSLSILAAVCLTLFMVSWALRLLEHRTFSSKIQ